MKSFVFSYLLCCFMALSVVQAQGYKANSSSSAARRWVNRTYKHLSRREKIAQLMVVRAHSNLGAEHVAAVTQLIRQYNIGGLCFFQGGPVRQALLTNQYQTMAKTPLMVCIDGEWGLGMRLDSVINYPRQLMLGALQSDTLVYEMGKAIGAQCKRLGINVNYAPDVDVNNNPNNPVINDRSFGEDAQKVAQMGIAYMKGMQEQGVMACAKHFPGHGDVAVDSHLDLPAIYKNRQQLDSLELIPFRAMLKAGVGSVMTAHLFIPSIDTAANRPTSLSPKAIKGLLQHELGFKGIIVTDGLEMKGVTKFYPDGEACVQAIIAGNDMLCVPQDVPLAISKIDSAVTAKRISWKQIKTSVKKVLLAKYNLGLAHFTPIDTAHLVSDLNHFTNKIKAAVAANAITLVRNTSKQLLPLSKSKKVAYVSIGAPALTSIAACLQQSINAKVYMFEQKNELGKQLMDDKNTSTVSVNNDSIAAEKLLATLAAEKYDVVVVGLHNYSRRPANNFGLSSATVYLLNQLGKQDNVVTALFGNPYAIKNGCNFHNLLVAYEDDAITQQAAASWLLGEGKTAGKLPVTVCPDLLFGTGIAR